MSLAHRALQTLREKGWRYAFRALRRRVATSYSRVRDRGFDTRFGSETALFVENSEMHGVPAESLAHGVRYEPTRAAPFLRLLETAGIQAEGVFVDVGCGKGRILMLAALSGFENVVGVDYSPELCRIATRNLEVMSARGVASFRFDVIAMDARDFELPPECRVVYMYNPFDDTILRPLVSRWAQALGRHSGPAWLIYHNPVWSTVIEESGGFQKFGDYSFGGCDFAVYRTLAAPGDATATPRTVTS